MTGATKQCSMEFAAFAAKDKDPKKLIELARKINERFDQRFGPLPEQRRSDADVLTDLRDALNQGQKCRMRRPAVCRKGERSGLKQCALVLSGRANSCCLP